MGMAEASISGHSMTTMLMDLAWTLAVPVFTWLGYMLIDELKTRGYQTRYVAALVRAVGAGADAANAANTTLFTPQGRVIGVAAAVAYLKTTVGEPARRLGIDDEGHALRVNAQIGTSLAEANPPLEKPVDRTDAAVIRTGTVAVPTVLEPERQEKWREPPPPPGPREPPTPATRG